jgi:GMP synthase (glutamine-hydrolysing)
VAPQIRTRGAVERIHAMATRTVMAIRHVHFEDLGVFAAVFAQHGFAVRYVEAGVDDLAGVDPRAADILVVLGGPIGVYEADRYPFLADALRLIERRLAAGAPTLGICLGAQLIARAMGADVYPGGQKEIGWAKVTLTERALPGPLRHFADTPVLHWHGDTFDLPHGTDLLASTALFPHQAFAAGANVLAFQFHPELAPAGFERWLIGHAVEIANAAGVTVTQLRADTARFAAAAAERGRRCLSDWLRVLNAERSAEAAGRRTAAGTP